MSGTGLLLMGQQISQGPNPWAQLGIGAIVCALLFSWGLLLWRDNKAKDLTIEKLNEERLRDQEARIRRERELSDVLAPLLAQAVDLLAKAPAQFDRALSDAQRATGQSELDAVIRRLEATTERLGERRDR